MNKTLFFCLLALGMFFGSMLFGAAPVFLATKPRNINTVSLYGAGLLIGVSVLIIIPEGIRAMYSTSFTKMKQQLSSSVAEGASKFH